MGGAAEVSFLLPELQVRGHSQGSLERLGRTSGPGGPSDTPGSSGQLLGWEQREESTRRGPLCGVRRKMKHHSCRPGASRKFHSGHH